MLFKKKENEVVETEEKKSLKDKVKDKAAEAKRKYDNFQLFLAFAGAIYFVINLIVTLTKNYKDSAYFPYLLGCTIAYIVVFVIFLLVHRKDKAQVTKDTKNFKSNLKIVKLIMNLLFIGSSLLIFIEAVQNLAGSDLWTLIQTGVSGLLLFFKLLSTIGKIIKTIRKRVKSAKKDKKKAEKQALKEA